ncbi:MAG: ABC transporter ATP-binding protein [Rhodospirillales bacterium]|nr:ABC transporter ATP-binding protein [Rhodospirillales bacterium]
MSGVEIERVSFGYGGAPILDDVSLNVAKGEFFAFLGPSGSGKTTLLRLVAGFGMPSSGTIRVGARDVTLVPPWKRNVGMVFQSYALWPHMTVEANVAFGLEQRGLPRAEIGGKVRRGLELVGLSQLAERRPAQLSGGQQQRVALARTLVVEPEVLLLDEPLSNLDAKLRVEMRHEISALQRKLGLTTIYVTHDQEEANSVADRIAVLDGGRIQQVGTPVELYDRPANRFVATFLGTANILEGHVTGRQFQSGGISIPDIDRADGPAAMAFRPQDAQIAPPDGPGFGGTIARREFLGGTIRYSIAAGTHMIVVDVPHHRNASALEIGTPVSVMIEPARFVTLAG